MFRKIIRHTFILFLSLILISCFIPDKPVDQVFEYNPKKAGAEIVARISFDDCNYMNYQNNQLYSVQNGKSADTVTFYDFTNDTVTAKKAITIPKSLFCKHYTYIKTQCVNIINDKMILLAKISDNSSDMSFSSLIRFDENDSSMIFYDHSSDFENNQSIYQFYYDTNHSLYLSMKMYYYAGQKISQYCFDLSEQKFIPDDNITFSDSGYIFLTHDYCTMNHYGVKPNAEVFNYLYINRYNKQERKKLNLTFLNIRNRLRGAFFDDENIWICAYIKDNSTQLSSCYLLKLKLLGNEPAENEFRDTGCW